MSPFLSWVVIITIIITSTGLLVVRGWRRLIIFLAVQYIGMFILTLQHLPLGMATVKIIAGWMSTAILGMTRSNLGEQDEDESQSILPHGRFFRLIAAAIVSLIALTGTPFISSMMADPGTAVAGGSLILIGMGLLHLGVSDQILRVTIGLMTLLSGFEILYATVESSVLVVALLAAINLGLALVGSYLIVASDAEETEPA